MARIIEKLARLGTALALLCVILAAPATAQRPQFRSTDPALQRMLERLEQRIAGFFDKELRGAALLIATDPRQRTMVSRVELTIDPSACEFSPYAPPYDPRGDKPPRVVMGRIFVLANLYIGQAIFSELMQGFQPGAVGRIERYVGDVINPARGAVAVRCDNPRSSGPVGDLFPAYGAWIGLTPARYAEAIREWGADPAAVALGDQLAMALAFVLMHEVGHQALGHTVPGRFPGDNDEIDADTFAIAIARKDKMSPSTAIGAFLAFTQADTKASIQHGSSIHCRVKHLLERDDVIAEHFGAGPSTLPNIISKFKTVIERMRNDFLAAYRTRCS
jgi:hypothetical protein